MESNESSKTSSIGQITSSPQDVNFDDFEEYEMNGSKFLD